MRKALTRNEWFVHRLPGHAIAMLVITVLAQLLGYSHGVMAARGVIPDIAFNVVVGTLILHFIDRGKTR